MDKPFTHAIGDIHASHTNIRLYCPLFREHYTDIDDMTKGIQKILNKQIPPGGKLLFVGDLSLNFDKGLDFIKGTHFDWYWICGNHDKTSRIHKGHIQSRQKALRECPNIKLIADEWKIQIGAKQVLVNHFPWTDAEDERHGVKYMEYRPRRQDYPGVSFLICGHKHSGPSERLMDRALDVGFDGVGRATTDEDIEEIISARDSYEI